MERRIPEPSPVSVSGHKPARPRWVLVLIGLALIYEAAVLVNNGIFMFRPNAGFDVYRPGFAARLQPIPVTAPAGAAVRGLEPPLRLLEVNGKTPAQLPPFGLTYGGRGTGVVREGASNEFLIRDAAGRTVRRTLPVARPDPGVMSRSQVWAVAFHLVGLAYFAIGLVVWWLRPRDRAALPLLLIGVVTLVNMSHIFRHNTPTMLLTSLRLGVMPLWGVTAFLLGVHFTGSKERRWTRTVLRIFLLLGGATSLGIFSLWHLGAAGWYPALRPFRILAAAGGLQVLAGVCLMVPLCWQAARPPNPLALRRRARFFAAVGAISFLLPSVSLVVGPGGYSRVWLTLATLCCLALFPLLTGYAIVRHQMFDLRVALRRGVISAALTLGVSLAYVGLVLLGIRLAAISSPSPLFIGASAVGVVVVFSLLHVWVQRAVDRFVHRTRYDYSGALARASDELTRARTLEGIGQTVRAALMDGMRLSRGYFAVAGGGAPEAPLMRCQVSWEHPDSAWEAAPLPEVLDPEGPAGPVRRAVTGRKVITTHDVEAVAAQSNGLPRGQRAESEEAALGEAAFWSHFGVEAVVPLVLGERTSDPRVVGLLLLGPRVDQRSLDSEDHGLLWTLANQLAMAVESCWALDEIRRLNEGLEQQVQERTRDLSVALEELKQAQSRLVESEMQAMLARLVAGILHEVNSPLGTLRSSVDTMERALARSLPLLEEHQRRRDPDVGRALRAVKAGAELGRVCRTSEERIRSVLDSLRRFVSLDEAEVMPLDLARSIDDALILLSASTGDRISVTTQFPAEPAVVRCYPSRINRVFLNLLQNAVNGIDGRGEIRVAVSREDGQAVVEIEDDGRGIPPERLPRLFELGFTTKEGGRVGMRLGLPSSKRWVEEAGGSLALTSEPGRGTRVRVALPAEPDHERD